MNARAHSRQSSTQPAVHLTGSLAGSLARIRWQDAESGFFIGSLDAQPAAPEQGSAQHTIKGTSPAGVPRLGAFLELQGAWVDDPKYGQQFAFTQLAEAIPPDTDGIARYLEVHTGGIGAKRARAIIAEFGADAFRVIEQEPARLIGLAGITEKQAAKIQARFAASSAERGSLTALHGWEIGAAGINAIKDHWGCDLARAVADIQVNPYMLSRHVRGFGFMKSDRVALRAGVPLNSPFRVQAAFTHCLEEAAQDGHTWLAPGKLLNGWKGKPGDTGLCKLLGFDPEREVLREAVGVLEAAQAVEVLAHGYALPRLVDAERQVAEVVRGLVGIKQKPWNVADDADTKHLNDGQGLAFMEVCCGLTSIMVLTGGAGTGKTTALKSILDTAQANNILTALCAPTGKAAKRMSEATGRPASTIHRLLRWGPFGPHLDAHIDVGLLVVDEASMVDVELMAALLTRIDHTHTRVLLVGDRHQLPPVGPGAPFRDIILSSEQSGVPVCELTEIMRNAADSVIPHNSRAVLTGDVKRMNFSDPAQMQLVEIEDPAEAACGIAAACTPERLRTRHHMEPEDLQVLSPMKKGPLGTLVLNAALRRVLNPGGEQLQHFDAWHLGDRVIFTHNNYNGGWLNGDQGVICGEDKPEAGGAVMLVDIEGELVRVSKLEAATDLQLGYAITVHKSQGSEWPLVVVACHTTHNIMLQRDLIYTAITRGKAKVVLVGTRKALDKAVRGVAAAKRLTLLQGLLGEQEQAAGA